MLKLVGSLGLAFAMADFRRRVRGAVRSGIFALCGATIFLIGLIFLLIAAHGWLSAVLNPAASAAIIGGVLIIVSLILFLLAARRPGEPGAGRSADTSPVGDAIHDGMSRFGAALQSDSPLRNPVLQAAGLAAVIGFLLGRRSKRDRE